MAQLKELFVEQMQDLLHAETLLTEALPKMADAANHPKLKEAFDKHLTQTEGQIERLNTCFELAGEQPSPKTCKGMMGLIEEGNEIMDEGGGKDPNAADLALIAAAQKVEHYEISAYGSARVLARQLGMHECARLLSHSLGEEEGADFLLTAIADPLVQQAALDETGAEVDLDTVPSGGETKRPAASQRKNPTTRKGAA
jgi:Mn-containing catalase